MPVKVCPATCADQRNVKITLEAVSSRARDTDGGWTDVYSPLSPSTAWAKIDAATPHDLERRVANTISAQVSHLVTIRYHKGVNTNTRVTFTDPAGTHTLYVRGMRNVEQRNIDLEMACEEVISPVVVLT